MAKLRRAERGQAMVPRGSVLKEKGQSMLEFALILPVLLIVLAGALDLGRLYFVYVAVTDAAAEGATYAAMNPDDHDEIKARAQAASGGLVEIELASVVVMCPTCPSAASGDSITVTVNYDFAVVTPLINGIVDGGVLPLRAVVTEAILQGEF